MPVGPVEFKTYYLPKPSAEVYSLIKKPTVDAAKQLGMQLQSKDVEDPDKLRAALLKKEFIVEIGGVPTVGAGLIHHLNSFGVDAESAPRTTIQGDYGEAEAYCELYGNSDIAYFLKSPNVVTEFAIADNPGTEFIQNF